MAAFVLGIDWSIFTAVLISMAVALAAVLITVGERSNNGNSRR